MPRLKASSATFTHRAEFDAAIDSIATLQVRLRILEGKRDKALQHVRDDYGPAIDSVTDELKTLVVLAEKFAETHRDEVCPPGRKSNESALAVFGFRLGNPTLKPLNKRWTWASVLDAVRAKFKGRFVRTKEELDKEALKAQLDDAQLATVGCRIEQREDFFVEAKDRAGAEAA